MTMNCDTVFDILTRGPFPTGDASDVDVEAHLAQCASCHRLAVALRPALELFQEAIPADEGRELPGYWGEIDDQPPRTATGSRSPAALLPAVWRKPRLRRVGWPARDTAKTISRFAAAILIGVGLGSAFWSLGILQPPAGSIGEESGGSVSMVSAAQSPPIPWQRLKSLMTPACMRKSASDAEPEGNVKAAAASIEDAQLLCCSQCHSRAASITTPPGATILVAQHCSQCHR